jgi:hypothetical protein
MRKTAMIVAGVALAAMLGGCGHRAQDRNRPDEFAVARQAPLVIPPDFALVPPQPGAVRPQDAGAAAEAQQALFGNAAPRSNAENAVLDAAGRTGADPAVRSNAGSPSTSAVDKGQTTRDIVAAPEGDGQSARTTAQP